MKRKNQFDQAKIIPAQPGWYACDALASEDLKSCVGIEYIPVIAWAVAEGEGMEHGEIACAVTMPIFATGGPGLSLSSTTGKNECYLLFYKDPDGNYFRFGEWLGSGKNAELGVINAYTEALSAHNK